VIAIPSHLANERTPLSHPAASTPRSMTVLDPQACSLGNSSSKRLRNHLVHPLVCLAALLCKVDLRTKRTKHIIRRYRSDCRVVEAVREEIRETIIGSLVVLMLWSAGVP
jgi:hypothetical protein